MLICFYFFLANVALPQLSDCVQALVDPIMVIIITLVGIIMLFGAVGMKVSSNLGATIMDGIFKSIGYIGRTIIQAIGWIVRNTFRMIPRVFNGSKRTFTQMGINAIFSNLLATIVVILFLAIVI